MHFARSLSLSPQYGLTDSLAFSVFTCHLFFSVLHLVGAEAFPQRCAIPGRIIPLSVGSLLTPRHERGTPRFRVHETLRHSFLSTSSDALKQSLENRHMQPSLFGSTQGHRRRSPRSGRRRPWHMRPATPCRRYLGRPLSEFALGRPLSAFVPWRRTGPTCSLSTLVCSECGRASVVWAFLFCHNQGRGPGDAYLVLSSLQASRREQTRRQSVDVAVSSLVRCMCEFGRWVARMRHGSRLA